MTDKYLGAVIKPDGMLLAIDKDLSSDELETAAAYLLSAVAGVLAQEYGDQRDIATEEIGARIARRAGEVVEGMVHRAE